MENFYEPLLKRIKLDDELPDIREITEELLSNDPVTIVNANLFSNENVVLELKWNGDLEWRDKPSNSLQSVRASVILVREKNPLCLVDSNLNDTARLPSKININFLSISVLSILLPITRELTSPNKLVLNTDSNVFKTTFSKHGGGLILFKVDNHDKFLLVVNQHNELVCREPVNEADFLKMVKEIIEKTKMYNISKDKEKTLEDISKNNDSNDTCAFKSDIRMSSTDNEVQCPVCLESLIELKSKNLKLKAFWNCGHIACESCCKQLMKARTKKINCPQCRMPSNVKQIRVLHI